MSAEEYKDPSEFFEITKERALEIVSNTNFKSSDSHRVCKWEKDSKVCGRNFFPQNTLTKAYCEKCTPLAQLDALRKAHREQHDEIIRLRGMLNGTKELIG